jgi:hypothetical protein
VITCGKLLVGWNSGERAECNWLVDTGDFTFDKSGEKYVLFRLAVDGLNNVEGEFGIDRL